MSQFIPQKKLLDKWNVYYHLPQNNNWDLASYIKIMGDIDCAEKVSALSSAVHENIVKNCMLFIMREGIEPRWEDPRIRNGGCFSYKISNKYVFEVWNSLFKLLCDEALTTTSEHSKYVNGITISPKKNFCIVKIWFSTIQFQDPGIITKEIPLLLKSGGCIFKDHKPEF